MISYESFGPTSGLGPDPTVSTQSSCVLEERSGTGVYLGSVGVVCPEEGTTTRRKPQGTTSPRVLPDRFSLLSLDVDIVRLRSKIHAKRPIQGRPTLGDGQEGSSTVVPRGRRSTTDEGPDLFGGS